MEPIPGIRAVLSQAQTAVKAEKGASAGDRGDAASNCSARGGVGSFVSDATHALLLTDDDETQPAEGKIVSFGLGQQPAAMRPALKCSRTAAIG